MATLQSQINILAAVNCGVDQRLSTLEQKMLEVQYNRTKTIIKNGVNNSQTVIDYLGYNAYDAMVVMKNEEGISDFFKREYNLMGYDAGCFKLEDDDKNTIDLALNPHILKLLELQYVTIENDIAKWEFKYTFNKTSEIIQLDETDYNIDVPIYIKKTSEKATECCLLGGTKITGQDYYKGNSSYYEHINFNDNNIDTLDSIYVITFEKDTSSGTYFKYNDNYTINSGTDEDNSYSIKNIEHISCINLNQENNYYINLNTSSLEYFTETLVITTPSKNKPSYGKDNPEYTLTKCEAVNNSLILYYLINDNEVNSTIISGDNKKILKLNRYYGNILSDYDEKNENQTITYPYKYYNLFQIHADENISYPEIYVYTDEDKSRIYETINDSQDINIFPRLDRIHLYSDESSICSKYKNINIINNMKPEIQKVEQNAD